ncbi:phosphoglucosamine mutase [Peijinzhouia sedimentorum]
MTLIKSISGIRGTIGGQQGDNLTPIDIVKFSSAYGAWMLGKEVNPKVVIGRDARPSGEWIAPLVASTLQSLGIDVIDLGLASTPTVEVAVVNEKAGGGIILTASHNPVQWNALKLLNEKGEFISNEEGQRILEIAEQGQVEYAPNKKAGQYKQDHSQLDKHIQQVLDLPLVDVEAIRNRKFKIVVDPVNSVGGIAIPALLERLGVDQIHMINGDANGQFAHNPEPLPENIREICKELKNGSFDLGIVVDPDVDRLALVCEDGTPFGEEYTLVTVADYVLSQTSGNTVSNLSSSRALKDVTIKRGGDYVASAVGEVNVVEAMKANNAIIGGEGNGGIIYPELHYGRDALVGIALFLTQLAKFGKSCSMLRASYPNYHISKNKIELTPEIDVDKVLAGMQKKYEKQPQITVDGVRIDFDSEWVHLRKSNTEPIIRIYAESESNATADYLANKIMQDIKEIVNGNE